eukprot:TRINITY_DN14327_c0_g1_i1.p2 TRINITY_DN14327_c0_g1~~TRINITY_DN14327_c0_g1_i1.p2  ORF type:complete len:78 (-),score=10.40 TRINITY_DN14327_c0_g1_i1:71-304(-)
MKITNPNKGTLENGENVVQVQNVHKTPFNRAFQLTRLSEGTYPVAQDDKCMTTAAWKNERNIPQQNKKKVRVGRKVT